MKTCVIISGGRLDGQFASEFIKGNRPDLLIAADKGLMFCHLEGIMPDYVVGDFDSIEEQWKHLPEEYEAKGVTVRKYNPVKDATDTEIALRLAIEAQAERITILGATEGNRLDHLFGNVHIMVIAVKAGVECVLLDRYNRIRILNTSFRIRKDEQYGKYVSFIPFTGEVSGVTLKGFRYPLNRYLFDVEKNGSLGISNEIIEDEGVITFDRGMLLMIESKE